jgi:hypothetical protein
MIDFNGLDGDSARRGFELRRWADGVCRPTFRYALQRTYLKTFVPEPYCSTIFICCSFMRPPRTLNSDRALAISFRSSVVKAIRVDHGFAVDTGEERGGGMLDQVLVQIERLLEVIDSRRGKPGRDALREIRNAEKGCFGRGEKSQGGTWCSRKLRHVNILMIRVRGIISNAGGLSDFRGRPRGPVIPQAEAMFYFCSPWVKGVFHSKLRVGASGVRQTGLSGFQPRASGAGSRPLRVTIPCAGASSNYPVFKGPATL